MQGVGQECPTHTNLATALGPEGSVQGAVLDRLGDVFRLEIGIGFEIRDGAGYFQDAIVGTALSPCCVMARSSKRSQSGDNSQNARMCRGDICALQ